MTIKNIKELQRLIDDKKVCYRDKVYHDKHVVMVYDNDYNFKCSFTFPLIGGVV